MAHEEKRKNTRVFFHTTASVRFAEDFFDQLEIRDLSLKGVYVEGVLGHRSGEHCDIALFLSGTSSEVKLSMTGEVIRTDGRGAGIRFSEIDIDTFFHLKNIVYYNAADPDKLERDMDEIVPDGSFVE
ncbi:MAG: PilZ domain-containing protein [Deltaproteobacteria bacterium]|nr:PilZ domain-containing protein [Deltaproteobacteria bacterium]